jgi:hypothetical protein
MRFVESLQHLLDRALHEHITANLGSPNASEGALILENRGPKKHPHRAGRAEQTLARVEGPGYRFSGRHAVSISTAAPVSSTGRRIRIEPSGNTSNELR